MKNIKKILFVTASYPPDVCGVGDYSERLLNALNKEANLFELFYKTNWSVGNLFSYLKEIKSKKVDLIHIQYPTEGYGYSFLPLLLMAFLPKKKIIVTIHELSNRTFKARVFTMLLLFFSNKIIVTNEIEYGYLKKLPILNRKETFIINIGSNIPKSNKVFRSFSERKIDLAYFGHIRPIKGLESFITIANKFSDTKRCAIIGQNLSKYQSYLGDLQIQSDKIDYILNGSALQTADNLSECKIVYLPFPDGVSSRRGSLMAAALNGCVIVTTYSDDKITNDFFEKYCYLVNNEDKAEKIIEQLLDGDDCIDKNVSKLMDLFSWEEIAKKHFEVYFAKN
jgi:glycosyltransferase involved in cell wall biosynthesis